MWLKFTDELLGFSFILCAVYFPHERSVYYKPDQFENFCLELHTMSTDYRLPVLLTGDFNARTANKIDFLEDCDDWGENILDIDNIPVRKNMDKLSNNNGNRLIELCKIFDMVIINGRYGEDASKGAFTCRTAKGASTIDYMIGSAKILQRINNFSIGDFDKCISDAHAPIHLCLNGSASQVKQAPSSEALPTMAKSDPGLIWKKENRETYINNFNIEQVITLRKKIEETENLDNNEINNLSEELTNLFKTAATDAGLKKKPNKKPANKANDPWFDKECREKKAEYIRLRKGAKHSQIAKVNANQFAKQYKQLVSKKRKEYLEVFNRKLQNMKNCEPKKYWEMLGDKKETKESNLDPDKFKKHFEELNEGTSTQSQTTERMQDVGNDHLDYQFTYDEIQDEIKKLKNNKASGHDFVLNEMIKNAPKDVVKVICEYFNLVLKTGKVPDDWGIGIIIPFYKNSGDCKDPENYRGITLISCIAKLFSACISNRLRGYVEGTGTLGGEQAGFREGFSTLDNAFIIKMLIDMYTQKKKKLFGAFLDYKKAFDTVDRAHLWKRLLACGINGKILNVVVSLYEKAKSCVRMNGITSSHFSCNIGVRQGDNLSPLLFALFLNDFEDKIRKSYTGLNYASKMCSEWLSDDDTEFFLKLFVLLYADDTLILAESEVDLAKALGAAEDYCKNAKLYINAKKSKVVVFSAGKIRKIPTFCINGKQLEVVFNFIYLGIVFNYNGSFKPAIAHNVLKGHRAMFKLLSKAKDLDLSIETTLELFDKVVVPVVTYGAELWGFENLDTIELFHRKFLKLVLGVRKTIPNCMVYGETGRTNISCLIKTKMMTFFLHLEQLPDNRYSKIFLQVTKKMSSAHMMSSKWLNYTHSAFGEAGIGIVLKYPNLIDKKSLKDFLKPLFRDWTIQEWQSKIELSSKTICYKNYKYKFELSNYLKLLSKHASRDICRFRCANFWLPLYKGIYLGTDKSCRLCEYYLGDEYHALLCCPIFAFVRAELIPRSFWKYPNLLNFDKLMNSSDIKILKNLAKFCSYITEFYKRAVP